MSQSEVLLDVRNLHKQFPIRGGIFGRPVGMVQAVAGVSFQVKSGETLGLVGESGCGKSTTGMSILRLIEPTAGEVLFDGKNVATFDRKQLKSFRRQAQIIFQDPYASLNPRMSVNDILAEPMYLHNIASGHGGYSVVA